MSDRIWVSLSPYAYPEILDAKRRKGESMMDFAKRSYTWQNTNISGASKREVNRYHACLVKLYGEDGLAPYSLTVEPRTLSRQRTEAEKRMAIAKLTKHERKLLKL